MAVNDIKYFDDFKKISENQGFEVVNVEDVSAKTIPTMRRFERYANGFFRTGFIAKILLKLLPKKFTWNILSGYLLPEIMRSGLGSYKILLLRKKDAR